MFPPFPEQDAYTECQKVIGLLEDGFATLDLVTKESEERSGNGLMFGVLVCEDESGKRVVLRTVSGISRKLTISSDIVDSAVFVPPIVSAEKVSEALSDNDEEIHSLTKKINAMKKKGQDCSELVSRRTKLCEQSLKKVHALYAFHCIDSKVRKLTDICPENPPTGTGDCCAPKLLDYAFSHSLTPISMAEVFYGRSSEKKNSGSLYPPCDERCALLLPAMLGLKIIYKDESVVVVEKPSGLLSVPGRGEDKQDCVVSRVKRIYPQCIEQPSVHRLDMETSGLMVLALTKEAHRELNRQFASGEVSKQYEAVLDGNMAERKIAKSGEMTLYFRLDINNRPHQIWDRENGKESITQWQIIRIEKLKSKSGEKRIVSRVLFTPLTGRTHQLRLASSDPHGFGIPIVGDTLYGTCREGERLLLHARYLSFTHPTTGKRMEFTSACPF